MSTSDFFNRRRGGKGESSQPPPAKNVEDPKPHAPSSWVDKSKMQYGVQPKVAVHGAVKANLPWASEPNASAVLYYCRVLPYGNSTSVVVNCTTGAPVNLLIAQGFWDDSQLFHPPNTIVKISTSSSDV